MLFLHHVVETLERVDNTSVPLLQRVYMCVERFSPLLAHETRANKPPLQPRDSVLFQDVELGDDT